MEAKDTVMNEAKLLRIMCSYNKDASIEEMLIALIGGVAEAQAEISFKAGIREVVEWMKKHRWQGHKAVGFDSPRGYLIKEDELKEWGIE